jgi:hypothetical protein
MKDQEIQEICRTIDTLKEPFNYRKLAKKVKNLI